MRVRVMKCIQGRFDAMLAWCLVSALAKCTVCNTMCIEWKHECNCTKGRQN